MSGKIHLNPNPPVAPPSSLRQLKDKGMDLRGRGVEKWERFYRDDTVTTPGVSNLIFEPAALIEPVMTLWQTDGPGRREERLDAKLRLAQSPFVFTATLASGALLVHSIGRFFGAFQAAPVWVMTAAKVSVIGGLVLTGIEALIETKDLIFHTLPLLLSLPMEDERASDEKLLGYLKFLDEQYLTLTPEEAGKVVGSEALFQPLRSGDPRGEFKSRLLHIQKKIERYAPLQSDRTIELISAEAEQITSLLSEERWREGIPKANALFQRLQKHLLRPMQQGMVDAIIENKSRNLAIRVRPWLAQEIDQQLPKLVHTLKHGTSEQKNVAREQIRLLLKKLRHQTIKKIIGHVIAYAAIGLTLAGLALTLISAPHVVVTLLLLAGMGLAISRYLFNKGIADHYGWNFKLNDCLPEIIKRAWRWYVKTAPTRVENYPFAMPIQPALLPFLI